MSRALDKETITSLQNDNLPVIYRDIVSALCSDKPQLHEIELLGKSHPLPAGMNVLVEENSIAIPKARLVQAFVVARQMLFNLVRNCPVEKRQDLWNASAVVLLMDPEHLTAANARKRLIQSYQEGPIAELEAVLENELVFVDSYLTSRLHRHTKSPTLWGHRRWLLEVYRSTNMEHDIIQDLKTTVLIAAERHAKNCYAWSHMRWLIQMFGAEGETNSEILSLVKDWCLRQPADTSGFSFLLFYLSRSNSSEHAPRIEASTMVCKEVLGLAVSFKWTHESVWVFLRTLVASGGVTEDQRTSFLKSIDTLLAVNSFSSRTQSIIRGAHEWCERYQQKSRS
ncbi:Protein prenyltransferase alpha subunit repeat-containing protein 1-B [Lachnellula occidentalis]|uniref:Protein prenyltransferase alpha subunit repeat-containing protein 1-B n=1 Tax=Lachnellula occidentalis TaxID=215460 RepID=A0A8H8UK98_9HELO|nr:Protein prenyltransferase alpha subunit repeat-containing protein 1-B [Lachnellula occidentalis]